MRRRLAAVPYDPYHDDVHGSRGAFPTQRAGTSAGHEDSRPPGFPDVAELADLNRAIHDDAGQPERFALDQRAPLLGVLQEAAVAYSRDVDGVIRTASMLAFGIARSQSFRDGNRRTAYWAAHGFFEVNGLGHLMGTDDHMVARYLNQMVEAQGRGRPHDVTVEKFVDLFTRRLSDRRPRRS
ncbi:hypothetical protein AB0L40_07145 [Patulibacter sp. NPDC049589]|uniref:hypothetical protein n=1 Tax=Patulibacter sp. NPDC049589 TaxID=3154731 RepID=UPI00343EA4D7